MNGDGSRVFNIDDGAATASIVSISSLKLTGGEIAANGGAVFTRESLSLTDMVIDKNFSTSTSSVGAGGGVAAALNNGAALTISRSIISNNQSTARGGGISLDVGPGGSALISNSQIVGNSKWLPSSQPTNYAGGGIYVSNLSSLGPVAIEESLVFGNLSDGSGGGISSSGPLAITNSTIASNSSLGLGGGIHSQVSPSFSHGFTLADSHVTDNFGRDGGGIAIGGIRGTIHTITRSTISRNTAFANQFGRGGGIYVERAQVQIFDSTINENAAASDGGGVFSSSMILMEGTTANNNVAGNGGGGMSLPGGGVIRESTITDNSAKTGGGLYASIFPGPGAPPTTTVSHSTIANNHASTNAGGVYATSMRLSFDHSIVAKNTSPSISDAFVSGFGGQITAAYSLIGDNSGSGLAEAPIGTPDANGNLIGGPIHGVIDPLLAPLADNGGPTFTHALLAGGPAINAGDLNAAAGVNGVPQFDQRGTPFGRVFNGRIDIGAFEYQQSSDLNLLVDTLVDENDGNYSRGDLSLREAIALANTWPSVDTIHFDAALITSGPAKILLTQGELKITSSMSIVGLGGNLLTIDAKGNDPTPNSVNGDGSRVFNIDDGAATTSIVIISGLTLTGGQITTDGGAVFTRESLSLVDMIIDKNFSTSLSNTGAGGGIAAVLRDGASLTMVRSQVTNNQSTARGGGISLDIGTGSSAIISGSEVHGNSKRFPVGGTGSSFTGGGIYIVNSDGAVTIDDSTVSDNISDGNGGGISFSGPLTVQHSTIARNSAVGSGGGIHLRSSTGGGLSLFDSKVTDNEAGNGGGIALTGSTTSVNTIARSEIASNFAEWRSQATRLGGGIYSAQGSLRITDSTIRDNSADVDGGGIYTTPGSSASSFSMEGSTVAFNSAATNGGGLSLGRGGTIRTSTIAGNSARTGGAIYASGTTVIDYSTVVQNEASTATGGITGGPFNLNHSIVALNTSPASADDIATGQITASWSLIGNNNGSGLAEAPIGLPDAKGNLIGGTVHGLIDPLLRPLANYGGLTPTFALSTGSPAINAGDPSAVAGVGTVPLFDQRGMYFPRVVANRIDIGAFEFHSPPGPTLVVDTLVDESDGNYAAGDLSLREALQLANLDADENTIQFSPALTANGAATILLTQGALEIVGVVTIIGPGATLLTIDASGNDPTPDVADGLGSSIFEIGDSTDDLLDISISGLTLTGGDSQYGGAILSTENLTITGSVITGNHSAQLGGGVAVLYGSVEITDCVISNNTTDGTGGGIDTSSAELVVDGCTIDDNIAAVGGGIHAYDTELSVSDSTIDNNQAIGGGGAGGGIYHKGRKLTIADSTISGNTSISGGGIYSDGEAEVVRSTLDGNYSYLHGGGIYSFGKLTVRETTISGSSTGLDGAGIHVAGDVLVDSSTLNDNDAGRYGGAIWVEVVDGTFTIINSTISGNHADNEGGGLWITGIDAMATIAHSTIADNSANHLFGFGGGVVLNSGLLQLDQTIVATNSAKTGPDLFSQSGTQLAAKYSLIGNAQDTSLAESPVGLPDANGNLIGGPIHGVIDPLLGPLADNGGPTFTHALLAGSPAINAGDLSAVAGVSGVPEFDQRGTPFVRVFGSRIDIGSFEVQPLLPPGDFNQNGIVDGADYTLWRNTKGSTLDFRADGNGDGTVDNADYQIWRANFGSTRLALGSGDGIQPATMIVSSSSSVDVSTTISGDLRLPHVSAVQALPQLVASPDAKHRRVVVRAEVALERRVGGLLAWLADRDAVSGTHQSASEQVAPSRAGTECAEADFKMETVDQAFATLQDALARR